MILLLHGVGTLLPWNMLISANDVSYDFKLMIRLKNTILKIIETSIFFIKKGFKLKIF
jgi:hypothetical protein